MPLLAKFSMETTIEQRIDSAVHQCERLGKNIDPFWNLLAIFAPNMNQMDNKIWRPAGDEKADDAQS
jgi:hypothetical protein